MDTHSPSEDEIFERALELSGEKRSAYLKEAVRGDETKRQRIEALLRAAEAAGAFMDSSPSAVSAATIAITTGMVPLAEKSGDTIGRYKLREQIGEGGCGVVYVAEQQEPVRRRVALKVIKLGMDTRQVIARFEAERQALALMDHPNIAKVLDAGSTDTGRPYFVMELVRGIKITDYCDKNNLSTEERLKLFIQVCSAIQHAHQKGIIHRDIKPSNILVTLHDGIPVPKVIDFGIAKATSDQRLTDKTIYTAYEQFIGTPAYMSPEQAEMSGLDVDTRSDIYSLGVLLYELLTGKTPFDAETLLKAGLDHMRKIIREDEPQRPSTRLSTLNHTDLTAIANHRRAEPPKLINIIRGDLDWIVMKALEKDRTRRFETVNSIAMDLQRHLNLEPVTARPPSSLYRLRKMFLRHKTAFGTWTAFALTITIALGGWAWLWHEHRITLVRADISEQIQKILRQEAKLRDLRSYDSMFNEAGELSKQYSQDVELKRKRLGPEHPELADALDRLARANDSDATVHHEALAIRLKVLGEDHPDLINSYEMLADAALSKGLLAEAEKFYTKELVLVKRLKGSQSPDLPIILCGLAEVYRQSFRLREAEGAYAEALAITRQLPVRDDLKVADRLNDLAAVQRDLGKLAEAESAFSESLKARVATYPDNPWTWKLELTNLVDVLLREGKGEATQLLFNSLSTPTLQTNGQISELNQIRVHALVRLGDWREALLVVQRVLDDSDFNSGWSEAAPLLVQTGNVGTFLLDRHKVLDRVRQTFYFVKVPVYVGPIAKASLLSAGDGPGPDTAFISKLVDEALNSISFKPVSFDFVKSLAEYRQGHFADAEKYAQITLTNRDAIGATLEVQTLSVLAMARQQLQLTNEARAALSIAVAMAENKLPKLGHGDTGRDWEEVLASHILVREARALIEARDATVTPEK